MKIPLLTSALAAILGLALAGAPITVQAQTSTNAAGAAAPAKAKSTKATKPKATQFKGSITAIDASSVTIANTQKTQTLAITPKTVFKKDKVVATAADFAVGDQVSGSFSTDASGAMTANTVNKKAPKAAAPAKTAPAAQ